MFSTAYVKYTNQAKGTTSTPKPSHASSLETTQNRMVDFSIPETIQLLGSSDYHLNTSHPSGPMFNLTYNGGLNFHLFDPSDISDSPPAFRLNQTIYLKPSHLDYPSAQATILTIPTTATDPYMIQLSETKHIINITASDLLPYNPNQPEHNINPVLTLPWIQHHS